MATERWTWTHRSTVPARTRAAASLLLAEREKEGKYEQCFTARERRTLGRAAARHHHIVQWPIRLCAYLSRPMVNVIAKMYVHSVRRILLQRHSNPEQLSHTERCYQKSLKFFRRNGWNNLNTIFPLPTISIIVR